MRATERGAARAPADRRESRLGVSLVLPAATVILLVALFPLGWTWWESFHRHDLRMPWLGRPFVGLANYGEALGDARFVAALARTALFAATSVALELGLGLVVALVMNRAFRGRGPIRAAMLVPWAIPTVVAGLVWRFMFDGSRGIVNAALAGLGLDQPPLWFIHPILAWVPIVAADVWKTTPFVALLLLAGLQTIDPILYEAARIDGASAWRRLRYVTLPLLKPAIVVALIFRTLDAFRVFDLVYAMTGGGPGTATEPLALYTFDTLLQHLRFGYGSTLSVIVFVITFALALGYIRLVGAELIGAER